ncbi:MAG: aldehyde ferredoxin oxidoreductase N-terminal domain-containing protein, partial [Dehalococcoidia bacterium]
MSGRGDILKVDLTTQRVSREPLSPELRRRFLGGHGVNTWLFWEHFLEVDPRIDPLSPDNVLIAGVGPLGATGYGGGTKMKWTFKSPAYDMFGDSVCGGNFGAQLRWAGYDHLVITGRADRPVYIWIDDDVVEIRDAAHLWGKDVDEADDLIKEELGDEGLETALVGRAGENLTAFASIIASRHRAAGRTGGGCVMGSKNLKGVAVRGTKGLDIHDPQGFFQALDALIA